MAGKLNPAGRIGKWVIVPIVVALAGYYLIGPRIGRVAPGLAKSIDAATDSAQPSDPAPIPTANSSKPSTTASVDNGPDVDVSVQKIHKTTQAVADTQPQSQSDAPVVPHKRRRHKSAPATDTSDGGSKPPVGVPPPDDGGSAGATTAG